MPDLKKPNVRCSLSFSKKCSSPSAKSTWSYGDSTPAYSYGGNTITPTEKKNETKQNLFIYSITMF